VGLRYSGWPVLNPRVAYFGQYRWGDTAAFPYGRQPRAAQIAFADGLERYIALISRFHSAKNARNRQGAIATLSACPSPAELDQGNGLVSFVPTDDIATLNF
jgi:hypothetical protein